MKVAWNVGTVAWNVGTVAIKGYFQLTGESGMECRNSGHQRLFPVDW